MVGVLGLGVDVDNGDADGMGNVGVDSMGGVGGVGKGGMVCVWITSGLPWTLEVAFSRASCAAFCNDGSTSLSRGSGYVLVDTGKGSCWCVGRG